MASVTRTVRFQKEEALLIDRFLQKNPVLDFSTLARLAITRFIQKPDLQLEAVRTKPRGRKSLEMGGEQ